MSAGIDCQCGHEGTIHFQDGCLSKAGGGYFCECMEFEPATLSAPTTPKENQ